MITKKLFLLSVMTPYLLLMTGAARAQSAHAFNSGMNCYGVWTLPDTGQTGDYTATFGEDNDYQPSATQPSYTIYNPVGISSVTVDNVTKLMWITNPAADAGLGATETWENAIAACEDLSYAGYTDWRLPNVRELLSLFDYNAATDPRINTTAFLGTVTTQYWSSTTYVPTTTYAWTLRFTNVNSVKGIKTNPYKVWCVRAGTR